MAIDAAQGRIREDIGYNHGALRSGSHGLQCTRDKLPHAGRKTRVRLLIRFGGTVRREAMHGRELDGYSGLIG